MNAGGGITADDEGFYESCDIVCIDVFVDICWCKLFLPHQKQIINNKYNDNIKVTNKVTQQT